MSEHEEGAAELDVPAAPAGDSLSARMTRRRAQAERVTSEKFPIPGWDDMLAVELRMLGWKTMRKVGARHEKIRDELLQEMYTVADQLVTATVGFYEIAGDGSYKELPGETWQSLARRANPDLDDTLTARQALLALIRPDSVVPSFWNDWQEWVKSAKGDVDEEVVADFGMTG